MPPTMDIDFVYVTSLSKEGIDPQASTIRYIRISSSKAQEIPLQILWKISCGVGDIQNVLYPYPESFSHPFIMFPLFKKRFYWVEKDSKGRMYLYRKKRENKVVKTCEKDEYKSTCDCPKRHDQACKYNHKRDDHKVQDHVHHHYFHDKSTPCTKPKPKPSHKKCAQYSDTDPIITIQTSLCHSRCRTRSASSSPSPAPKGKRQASPPPQKFHKAPIRYARGDGVLLESTKLERYRLEREGDFNDGHDKDKQKHRNAPKAHEQPRGRARDRRPAREDTDDADDESFSSDCSDVRTGIRTNMLRAVPLSEIRRDREYERVTWDQDLGAWVAKRKPSVRFE